LEILHVLKADYLYWLIGAFLLVAAFFNLRDKRYATAVFWTILIGPFVFGTTIIEAAKAGVRWPAQLMGMGVIALGILAARWRLTSPPDSADVLAWRQRSASLLRNRLFMPALLIPALTVALFVASKWAPGMDRLMDPKALTLSSLAIASLLALAAGLWVTRARVAEPMAQGRRLLDSLGWAVLLPMVLATLGGVFAATGVGEVIASLVGRVIPIESRVACLLAFASGMVLFTIIMGNAFAAFPVMMAGIGLPLLIGKHGADPAILGAIGMLTGYCGTLLTPMAANFNIVPAVLLELKDPYAVIRSQAMTAFALMAVNIALMLLLCFR
jgi:uncharacterized membrane protein